MSAYLIHVFALKHVAFSNRLWFNYTGFSAIIHCYFLYTTLDVKSTAAPGMTALLLNFHRPLPLTQPSSKCEDQFLERGGRLLRSFLFAFLMPFR